MTEPVPCGSANGAFDQRQNDVFGAVLDSILLHTRKAERLPRRLWPIVETQAECASQAWRQADQGIWEARGKPQHYVSSKLMCWVALDRATTLAAVRGDAKREKSWRETADEIHADILDKGVKHTRRSTPALRDRRARCVHAPRRELRPAAPPATSDFATPCLRSPTS